MSLGEIIQWIDENYHSMQDKYAGKYISVRNKEVLATGDSIDEVIQKTQRLLPKDTHFHIEFIERGDLHAFNIGIPRKTPKT